MQRRQGLMVLLSVVLVTAVTVGGCEGDSGGCPAGYQSIGGACQPILADVTVVDQGKLPDAVADAFLDLTGNDTAIPDTTPTDTTADVLPDGVEDVPPPFDIPEPEGIVGDPCRRDLDCDGDLICLGWPGGYCSQKDCDDPDQPEKACPDGAVCMSLLTDTSSCFRACTSNADCRPWEGRYACKRVPDDTKSEANICHEVLEEGAGGWAAPCTTHTDCAGQRACVEALPGGACLELFCSPERPCADPNTVCARLDGVATCLPRCTIDDDCAAVGVGTASGEVGCGTIRDITGTTVAACLSSTAGLTIGERCVSGVECLSEYCEILGQGLCTGMTPRLTCFDERDCPVGSLCEARPRPIGVCSYPCSAATPCSLGGRCAAEEEGAAACRPTCEWDLTHTSHDCTSETGWSCVWGVPIGDEAREGYVCHELAGGSVGASCSDDFDCTTDGATCYRPDPTARGFCTRTCGPATPCPFGSYCLDVGQGYRCQRVCHSGTDCPDGLVCGSAGGRFVCRADQ